MAEIKVSELWIYPVKSCRGIRLDEAELTPFGFRHDRRWMVVDAKGRFLTQRRFPMMALIAAEPTIDGLWLSAPERPTLAVTSPPDEKEHLIPVRVWGHDDQALDAGDGAAEWLSELLGVACRLVTVGESFHRPVDERYDSAQTQLHFADGFPFLLLSQGSLDDLNGRLGAPVAMNRFRPNIVVTGCEPFAEDRWRQLRIGTALFDLVKPCSRCTIPSVDQESGARGAEPIATLEGYRQGEDEEIYFGQNLIHQTQEGRVAVGMAVEVLA